jgi:hypothetical protein
VRGLAAKLFAAVLLTLCVGIHALEVSGRWDQTLPDANDEAGIVAVVLCVGVAFAVAGAWSKAIRLVRMLTGFRARTAVAIVSPRDVFGCHPLFAASPPPLPLRI